MTDAADSFEAQFELLKQKALASQAAFEIEPWSFPFQEREISLFAMRSFVRGVVYMEARIGKPDPESHPSNIRIIWTVVWRGVNPTWDDVVSGLNNGIDLYEISQILQE